MPFSFTPNVAQNAPTTAPSGVVSAPAPVPAAFGSSAPGLNMMERAKSEGSSIIETVLFFLFGLSIVVALGLFGYKYYLSAQLVEKKAQLASYDSQLQGLPLEDMRKVSNRMKIAKELVNTHPSVRAALLILEESIENKVTYTKFNLLYSDTSKTYKLALSGVAPDYESVAQQLDTYNSEAYKRYISNIKLVSVAPDTYGNVTFALEMSVGIQGIYADTFDVVGTKAATSTPPAAAGDTQAVSNVQPTGAQNTPPVSNLQQP